MQRLQSSAALVISALALFVALGGSAIALSQIGTSQIQDGAITTSKLHKQAVTTGKLAGNAVTTGKLANNAVSTSKIAPNAVTGTQVADGSLSASDIAPNTFLAANGTAANSQQLGGLPANQYVQGRGSQVFHRIVVQAGQTLTLLSLGFGTILGHCSAGGIPTIGYRSEVSSVNLVDWVTNYGSPNGSVAVHTTNGLTNGNEFAEPNAITPQSVTWQAAYNDGVLDHVATAWTTGQDIGTTSCIFIGQGVTTG